MSHEPRTGTFQHIQVVSNGETQSETEGTTSQSFNDNGNERRTHSPPTNVNSEAMGSHSVGENIISIQIIQSLKNIIESFRKGDINKARAISKLVSTLAIGDDSIDSSAKESAFIQYITSIDSFSRSHSQSDRNGKTINSRFHSDQISAEHDIEQIISDIAASSKRGSSEGEEEEDRESDKSERGLSNKKQRLYEDEMPWFKKETIARQSADPSCQATCKILGKFGTDFAYVK